MSLSGLGVSGVSLASWGGFGNIPCFSMLGAVWVELVLVLSSVFAGLPGEAWSGFGLSSQEGLKGQRGSSREPGLLGAACCS